MNFGLYRAIFLKSGVDPRMVGEMSLYEIVSMANEMAKLEKKTAPTVSDEDWGQAEDLLASVTLNDPSVRLH